MKIIIETIEHSEQRYPTVGDWYWAKDEPQTLHVKVSEMERFSNSACVLLIGIHEVIEALLCYRAGITDAEVDDFDITFAGAKLPGEPGDHSNCPYCKHHFFATSIERLIAQHLTLDWNKYEAEIERLG